LAGLGGKDTAANYSAGFCSWSPIRWASCTRAKLL